MKTVTSWLAILMVSGLVACGGGGESPSSVATQSAEGLWQGSTSDGFSITAAVLENGEIWALASSSNGVVGFINGTSKVSGSSISGSETSYNLVSHTYTPLAFTGTVSTKNRLTLTTTSGSLNASYTSGYDQTPAPLSSMAGTYSGWLASVNGSYSPSSAATISSTGQISAPGSPCSANGSISPRASGKNIYDVTIAFTGSSCTATSTPLSGVAVYSSTSGVLVILALNGSKSNGLVYSASKQSSM